MNIFLSTLTLIMLCLQCVIGPACSVNTVDSASADAEKNLKAQQAKMAIEYQGEVALDVSRIEHGMPAWFSGENRNFLVNSRDGWSREISIIDNNGHQRSVGKFNVFTNDLNNFHASDNELYFLIENRELKVIKKDKSSAETVELATTGDAAPVKIREGEFFRTKDFIVGNAFSGIITIKNRQLSFEKVAGLENLVMCGETVYALHEPGEDLFVSKIRSSDGKLSQVLEPANYTDMRCAGGSKASLLLERKEDDDTYSFTTLDEAGKRSTIGRSSKKLKIFWRPVVLNKNLYAIVQKAADANSFQFYQVSSGGEKLLDLPASIYWGIGLEVVGNALLLLDNREIYQVSQDGAPHKRIRLIEHEDHELDILGKPLRVSEKGFYIHSVTWIKDVKQMAERGDNFFRTIDLGNVFKFSPDQVMSPKKISLPNDDLLFAAHEVANTIIALGRDGNGRVTPYWLDDADQFKAMQGIDGASQTLVIDIGNEPHSKIICPVNPDGKSCKAYKVGPAK